MVMVLEQEMVEEIGRIGRQRKPAEACGLLLPFPVEGKQVVELPNRSSMCHDSFEMKGEDIILALETIFPEGIPHGVIHDLVVWHTHPGGNVGPSRGDLQNKPKQLQSLVVSLSEDGPDLASMY